MILEIDAGNSRIKWRLLRGVDIHTGKAGEGILDARMDTMQLMQAMARDFSKLPRQDIAAVRASSVRGRDFADALTAMLQTEFALRPGFAQVEKSRGGVTNAYGEVSNMGVDRWLAMLAAFDKVRGACCILDCGSAMTLDIVDAGGLHLGGYIVPGLRLMQESLARDTSALEIHEAGWLDTSPGRNTDSAINHGLLTMALGFVERCRELWAPRTGTVHWLVTGGDAAVLSSHLDWQHRVEKDLVLDGLAIAMES